MTINVTRRSQNNHNNMDLENFLLMGAKVPAASGRSIVGVQRSIAQAGERWMLPAFCLLNSVPELEDSDDDGATGIDSLMETSAVPTPEVSGTDTGNSVSV
jgi:hypothetical protein